MLAIAVSGLLSAPAVPQGTPQGNGGATSPGPQPPLVGPALVTDGFRAPATRFGAGNRSIDLAAGIDTVVVAPGAGEVAVARSVFGSLVVSIDHPSGLRSVLSGLDNISVSEGDIVAPGDPVGTATGQFSVSLRVGRAYLDPTTFWPDTSAPLRSGRARLIPEPSP